MHKHTLLFTAILLLLSSSWVGAQTFSGYVLDKQSKLALSGAEVISTSGKSLARSDSLGLFTFEAHSETMTVIIFVPGYMKSSVKLRASMVEHIGLLPFGKELDELNVSAYRQRRGNSSFSYSRDDIKRIITTIGETDVMRYLQILPGVSQGMEGGMGFYVRGAGNGNNRIELDGVPIIGPTHLLGIFSTFHPDIIARSTFQMGGISASSGDFLSSLLQIETHKPTPSRSSGSVSISPLMLSASLQGSIIPQKLSYQIAGRTSLLRPEYLLLQQLSGKENISGDLNPQVQDLYGKLYWRINPRHTTQLMVYGSHDSFDYKPELKKDIKRNRIDFGWNNRAARVTWDYFPSKSLHLETSAYYSSFDSYRGQVEYGDESEGAGLRLRSEKSEWAVRSQLFTRLYGVNLHTGVDWREQTFEPVAQTLMLKHNHKTSRESHFRTSIASAFGEGEYKSDRYKLKAGLRYNLFRDNNKQLGHYLDVHLQGSMFLTRQAGLEVTFDRFSQFQHTLEGLPVGWALDLTIPASKSFAPETSTQFYIGSFWGNTQYYITLGAYYRTLSNLTAYKSMLNYFSVRNVSWEEELLSGRGTSYGLELWAEKRQGRLTGSVSYTLSRTTRQFDEINSAKEYPFKLDRTHNLNIQSQYRIVQRQRHEQRANIALYASSGNRMTIPMATYQAAELPYWLTQTTGWHIPPRMEHHALVRTKMSSKNAYRLPYYLRLDIGYTFLWKGSKRSHELTISAFNALNRQNPYLVFNEDDRWRQMSVLPIIPSIRWEMRF